MKKTLLSALVVIALTAQLTGCNGNTPVEQPNESSSAISDVSEPQNSTSSSETESSSEPQNSTTATTSSVPEVSEPQNSTVSTTSEPATSSSESNSHLEEKAKASYAKLKEQITIDESKYVAEYVRMAEQGATESDIEADLLARYGKDQSPIVDKKDPTWTETAASGTYYINTACSSRAKAIQGSDVVKQYKLNDTVNVIAKTDTGYYKLADGEFIHGDYLSTSKVTVQQPTQPSGGNTGNGSTAVKPFTGEKKKPSESAIAEGVTQVGEEESGVDNNNYETIGYWVEAPGGRFWFCENNGRYYYSMEDRLNGKQPAGSSAVFKSDNSIGNGIHLS